MSGQQPRWLGPVLTAAATALVVVVQHVLAHRADLTYWGPYEAGAEEVPPLDVGLSAWFLGAGAAVVICRAVRSGLPTRLAATIVFVTATLTAAAALAVQDVPVGGYAGQLSWPDLLIPHAVAALLGSAAGVLAARHRVGAITAAGWGVLWIWTVDSALETTRSAVVAVLLSVLLLATLVLVGVAVGRARRQGVSRLPLVGAVAASAALPAVVFALAQSKLLPDVPGFEADDTHLVALIWAAFALGIGALATLLPAAGRRGQALAV